MINTPKKRTGIVTTMGTLRAYAGDAVALKQAVTQLIQLQNDSQHEYKINVTNGLGLE